MKYEIKIYPSAFILQPLPYQAPSAKSASNGNAKRTSFSLQTSSFVNFDVLSPSSKRQNSTPAKIMLHDIDKFFIQLWRN